MTAPLPLAGDLFENMEKARAFGYDAIEFHTREFYEFDMERIAEMRREDKGDICALVTGRLFTQGGMCLMDENADGAIAGMKTYIEKASKLGVDIILGWAKGNVAPGADRDTAMDLLASRMTILNDYGKEYGVKIMVEVINHYETNIFNTAKETLDFFEKYGLDNCFVHLDTYHMNIEEFDLCAAIRLCGDKLGYFHVADNSRRYPGSGQLDFKKILATLDEIGYTGYVTLECIPEPDRDTAAKKAIAHLMACEPTRRN